MISEFHPSDQPSQFAILFGNLNKYRAHAVRDGIVIKQQRILQPLLTLDRITSESRKCSPIVADA